MRKLFPAVLLSMVLGASAAYSGVCDLRCAGHGGAPVSAAGGEESSCPAHPKTPAAPEGRDPGAPCHGGHRAAAAWLASAPAAVHPQSVPASLAPLPAILRLPRASDNLPVELGLHHPPRGPSLPLVLRV